jgi:hypothetical protein
MRSRVGWFVLLFCLLAWYTGPGISQCKAQTFGPWSEPVNVPYPINTEFNDTYAILSRDGLTMYFTSDRPGGLGGDDLWVAKRESLSDPWQVPTNMGAPINTVANDSLPALSSDEHVMFFHSTRAGGCGAGDIWMIRRQDRRSEDWGPPLNVGCMLNTEFTEIALPSSRILKPEKSRCSTAVIGLVRRISTCMPAKSEKMATSVQECWCRN